jgi:hypothetical protein
MKENILEFETELSLGEIGSLFQRSVTKRPLKLKVMPFKFFTPTLTNNPFAQVDGSILFDFEVGASFNLPRT